MKRSLRSISGPLNFGHLHKQFGNKLKEAFNKQDASILRQTFDSFGDNSDADKKSPLDQAFRDLLVIDLNDDIEKIGSLIKLSVEAVRLEIVSVTIPVVLLSDIFETVTLDKCEQIFKCVEEMVEIWKEPIFFTSCKNNILRMCNDLLRRLSRTQNTVFCGRILLFLSKFFPFSERSGLNVVSEFNLDNVTEYGVEEKGIDDGLEGAESTPANNMDYNLYCKFWSLQDFFRNPNQCYSKQWKMFQTHSDSVLAAFDGFKLEESRLIPRKQKPVEAQLAMDVDAPENEVISEEVHRIISYSNSRNFFAKYLTNPKLLALQLTDSTFRRSILLQFLILFQYLQQTVKYKTEVHTLTNEQVVFIEKNTERVYSLLEETPPYGKLFVRTVKHMLSREEMWNNWKNEGCKEFKKPDETEIDVTNNDDNTALKPSAAKRPKRPLGDCLRDAAHKGKFYLGNDVLTRLWNLCPDNLQACKSEERNFLPNLDSFLENQYEENNSSYEWRALRLLAHQSPHFFTLIQSQQKVREYSSVREYIDNSRRKLDKYKDAERQVNNGTKSSNGISDATNENEDMALQEQDQDQESESETEQGELSDELKPTHNKPLTATKEQIEAIVPFIGENWKKLGKKIGFSSDELLYFETEYAEPNAACVAMLTNWFSEDEDATLDNWSYILEGLEMYFASKAVKEFITPKEIVTDTIEVLSD